MHVKCPACNAGFALEAALALDAGRSALLVALQMPAPLGALLAQYLGMFRSANRALAFDRVEKLLVELQPMLSECFVMRDGLRRAAPLSLWQQGLERMVELRNTHKLDLPLKTHGYLLEIVSSLAEREGAKAERAVESQRRSGSAREQGDRQLERLQALSQVRGDLDLGLIDRDQASDRLRAAGINPEVLDARG